MRCNTLNESISVFNPFHHAHPSRRFLNLVLPYISHHLLLRSPRLPFSNLCLGSDDPFFSELISCLSSHIILFKTLMALIP